jgi:CRP-like cAMP-binding protein
MQPTPERVLVHQSLRPRVNRLLASLNPTEQNLLSSQLRLVDLPTGTVLELRGEPTDQVCFPLTGAMVSVLQTMRDGASVEVAAIGSEGVVGSLAALGSGLAPAQAVVQLPGTFSRISVATFRIIMQERPALREKMVRYNEGLVAHMQQSIACNALHDVEARLCRWLLLTQDRTGSHVLPFTQEFVGHMLGVRRTTITLVAGILQGADVIRCGRGKIEILDRQALEKAACECYAADRGRMDRCLASDL